jgi:hypothetical protein
VGAAQGSSSQLPWLARIMLYTKKILVNHASWLLLARTTTHQGHTKS